MKTKMDYSKEYKINEIFYSIQGEGRNTGLPAIFIRFSGCNLNCKYCDTNHEYFNIYTGIQLVNKIFTFSKKYNTKNIIFTGGEPMLQLDEGLIKHLKEKDYYLCIETNGTIHNQSVIQNIDWLTISPKSLDIAVLPALLYTNNELKLIFDTLLPEEIKKLGSWKHLYLQPKHNNKDGNYIENTT